MGSGLAVLWPGRLIMIRSAHNTSVMVAGNLRRTSGPPACEVGVVRSHFGAGACDAPASRSYFLISPIDSPRSAISKRPQAAQCHLLAEGEGTEGQCLAVR